MFYIGYTKRPRKQAKLGITLNFTIKEAEREFQIGLQSRVCPCYHVEKLYLDSFSDFSILS